MRFLWLLCAFFYLLSPSLLASLILHYDASSLNGVNDGQVVNSLVDLSGNNNIANAAGSSGGVLRSNGIGGAAAIEFIGSQGYLSSGNLGLTGDVDFTMVGVFNMNIPVNGFSHPYGISPIPVPVSEAAQANHIVVVEVQANQGAGRLDFATGFSHDVTLGNGSSFGPLNNQSIVLTLTHQSGGPLLSTVDFFINGDAPGEGILAGQSKGFTSSANADILNLDNGQFFLGGGGISSSFQGLIGEVQLYDEVLSENERKNVESLLSQKYNIDGNFTTVPEPSSLLLLLFGGLILFSQRRFHFSGSKF